MTTLTIRGGRVIDPGTDLDAIADVVVVDGRIERVSAEAGAGVEAEQVLDASGLVVAPGFVDLHVHLREPGQEHKETIASGTRAAAAGGFTTVCAMPNTEPPMDTAGLVEATRANASAVVRVLPVGCISMGRLGVELAPVAELVDAGVVALSDDGDFVADAGLMRKAFEYAAMWDLPLSQHCEEPALVGSGQMHEGWVSARLGLAGRPASAEIAAVARDLALAEQTGGHLHVQHLSTARAVELVAEARSRGVQVTAEVTPHHLTLNHEAVAFGAGSNPEDEVLRYDSDAKCNPPLREPDDVAACVEGLRSGVIDCIATDHAPHAPHEKEVEFDQAPAGMIGLETAFALGMRLVESGAIDLATLIERLTLGPVRAWGLEVRTGLSGLGTLSLGAAADIVLIDPEARWTVSAEGLQSQSRNTPLLGETLTGQVLATVYGGAIVHEAGGITV